MKKENQAIPASAGTGQFEGTLDLRRHPIDPEHYGTVAQATAEALADEIANRMANAGWSDRDGNLSAVRMATRNTLTEWFTGKFTPGGKP